MSAIRLTEVEVRGVPDYYDEMGDPVFRAQFRTLEAAFRADGRDVRVEPYADRDVHYEYVPGEVLVAADREDSRVVLDRVLGTLPRARVVERSERDRMPEAITLVRFAAREGGDEGGRTVPDVLEEFDDVFGRGRVTPNHVLSIAGVSNCPGTEPDPVHADAGPWPALVGDPGAGAGVRIGVPDSGFVSTGNPWLASGVGGDTDPNVATVTAPPTLHEYAGHGTFIAGVARCAAPAVEIEVSNHFRHGGANVETEVFDALIAMIRSGRYDIVSLSAGGYTRFDVPNLAGPAVAAALADNEKTLLLAAAGNDHTRRPFYPAALREVVGVGALGFDLQRRAWFSNHGRWVDVWALGEGHVNAYPNGTYTYNEPPRKGYQMSFSNELARWSGTSFATPLVAGLVAAEMTRTGTTSRRAMDALLARAVVVPGAGPAV
jgi:hypothetical protein